MKTFILLLCLATGLVAQGWVIYHLILIAWAPSHTVSIGEPQAWAYTGEIIMNSILFALSVWLYGEIMKEKL